MTHLVLVAVLAVEPVDGGVDVEGTAATSEMDEVEALEEAAVDPSTRAEAAVRSTVEQLGVGSLLGDRLAGALEASAWSGQELAFELAPVDDVGSFDVSTVAHRYDIPVEMNELVAEYIRFFQGAGRKWFRRWMNRSTRFIPLMQPILEERGLPADTVYLSMIESGFNTQARSWARAVGPWQFIAGTAVMFRLKEDFWVDERRDPIKATVAAASYLTQLHQEFGHWYLAWAGYNSGGGRVRQMVQRYDSHNFWELSERKGFARETKHYVPKLIACAIVAKHPQAFGFSPDEFEFMPPFEFDEVELTDATDLDVVAEAAGTTVEEIQELNPELKRWSTPPATAERPYRLRVPAGRKQQFAENLAAVPPAERLAFKVHRVVKGDTLSRIAARYGSAPEAILRMNQLATTRTLKIDLDLVVPVPRGKETTALAAQVVRARRSGFTALRPEEEIPAGLAPAKGKGARGSVAVASVKGKTQVTYAIVRGDSLWAIARRFDVHVADLKAWNEAVVSMRKLKLGTKLVIWPGPKAQLAASGASAGAP